jgi:hypothetical protein
MKSEQDERITENYRLLMEEAEESGVFPSLMEFEDVFEDRDIMEFM